MLGFRKRKLEVKLVPDHGFTETIFVGKKYTPEQIADITNEFVTRTAITVGTAYSAAVVLKSICKIAEIAAKAKLK